MWKMTSRQFAKRRKTTHGKATAVATAGVPVFDSLPPELLDIIFGFLDVRTLCTARLVCTQFRGAASTGLHSVKLSIEDLRSRPETNLNNFPNLSRVTVFGVGKDDLPILAQGPLADAVTHLEAAAHLRLVPPRARGAPWPPVYPLANLLSLTVTSRSRAFPFPLPLRELTLESPVYNRAARLVTKLTNLTCLRIDVGSLGRPFTAVTALTALQHLEICSDLAFAPFLAPLTQLTHLQFKEPGETASYSRDRTLRVALASLSRFSRLVHLGVGQLGNHLGLHLLEHMGTLTRLRSLAIGLSPDPEPSAFETVLGPPFSQLTALRLECGVLGAFTLPEFNLERLQHLVLASPVKVGADGAAALNRATGLTQLDVWVHGSRDLGPEELGIALSRMRRLRALSVSTRAREGPLCFDAIGLLSELTSLECVGGYVSCADVKVCLGLGKLRVLGIEPATFRPAAADADTQELLFGIAKLPELTKFTTNTRVWSDRLLLTDATPRWLNAERREKGWPPLELIVRTSP